MNENDNDPDDYESDPLLPDEEPIGRKGFVPDFVRKMAVAGIGAVFLGEEGLRSLAGQLKLPKEALGYLVGQAERTKDEITRVVSEELRRFLQSEKVRDEFLKLVSGMTVEIKAQVRLVPPAERGAPEGDSSLLPKVESAEIKTKSGRKKKSE
ncbi:MAG: hypothetical protein ACJ790_01110 [Myxococcaceae bacterium]